MSKFVYVFLFVLALLALAVSPVMAQDGNPTPTDPATFIERLLLLVSDVTYIPAAAAGVVVFTSAISFLLFQLGVELSGTLRGLIALAIQVIVWVAYTLLTRAGFEAQFTQWYGAIVTIVQALLPLAGAMFLAHKGYEGSKASGVPLLGFTPKNVPGSNAYRKAQAEADVKAVAGSYR